MNLKELFGRRSHAEISKEHEASVQPEFVTNTLAIKNAIDKAVQDGITVSNLTMLGGEWRRLDFQFQGRHFAIHNHSYGNSTEITRWKLSYDENSGLGVKFVKVDVGNHGRNWTKINGHPEEFGDSSIPEMPVNGVDISLTDIQHSSFRGLQEDFRQVEALPSELGPKTTTFVTQLTEQAKLGVHALLATPSPK